jgi:hypothetical protein
MNGGGAETGGGGGGATKGGGEGPTRGGGGAIDEGGLTEEEKRPTVLSTSGRRCCWNHLEPSSARCWTQVQTGGLFGHLHQGSAGDGLRGCLLPGHKSPRLGCGAAKEN